MTEQAYLDMLSHIMEKGTTKTDRTGTGTKSVFGKQLRFDLSKGFPLITTKKIDFQSIATELLWFLSGSTNIKYLVDNECNIWVDWPLKRFYQYIDGVNCSEKEHKSAKEYAEICVENGDWVAIKPTRVEFIIEIKRYKSFADMYGELGPVYGYQWRYWPGRFGFHNELPINGLWVSGQNGQYGYQKPIDQIAQSIEMLKSSPNSRRNIVSAWNVADIEEMAVSGLPPCHFAFQWNTRPIISNGQPCFENKDGIYETFDIHIPNAPVYKLDCHVSIRSWDTVLGGPYNIASYALLIHLYAKQVNMVPGDLIISSGDTHIYSNHENAVREQLSRTPYDFCHLLPLPDKSSIFDYNLEDILLSNYQSHPVIKAPIAV